MTITQEATINAWAGLKMASLIRPDLFPTPFHADDFFQVHMDAMLSGEYDEISYGGFTLRHEQDGDGHRFTVSLNILELNSEVIDGVRENWAYSAFAEESTAKLFNI